MTAHTLSLKEFVRLPVISVKQKHDIAMPARGANEPAIWLFTCSHGSWVLLGSTVTEHVKGRKVVKVLLSLPPEHRRCKFKLYSSREWQLVVDAAELSKVRWKGYSYYTTSHMPPVPFGVAVYAKMGKWRVRLLLTKSNSTLSLTYDEGQHSLSIPIERHIAKGIVKAALLDGAQPISARTIIETPHSLTTEAAPFVDKTVVVEVVDKLSA